jgi:hypothetical protein
MRRAFVFGLALAAVVVVSRPSDAHFVLDEPACWMSQDSLGLPEKLGPCGDEDDGTDAATPTGIVTAYQVGDTITVTIDEKIFHPGHYRIALSVNDRSELPPEPAVTADSTSPCGTAAIEDPPVFPVLADNVFPHTAPFSGPQTTTVTLPPNVTCTKCTLQVIEFMSNHALNNPGGCFYHHCADISVGVTDGGTGADAGPVGDAAPGPDAGVGAEPEPQTSGCSCDLARRRPPLGAGLLAFTCLFFVRRASRRRRRRSPD